MTAAPQFIETSGLCLVLVLLTPLAAIGLALINAGLGRSRSAAHSIMASLCVLSVATCVYFVCGFGIEGYPGRPQCVVAIGGKIWGWLAAESLLLRRLELDLSPASLAACLQFFSVGLAALIPLGSGAERWRLGACCASTAIFAGFTYPLFGHWAWGGGWLAQLGVNYGLGRGFMDAGGSGVIHAAGGLTALSITWILGPRRGKYSSEGMPVAIPGHNAVFVLFGCLLAWLGWLGLNGAGSLLFAGAEAGRLVRVVVNTTLGAAAAALVAALLTRVRFGKPDASLTGNGWIGGLVAGSAGFVYVAPAEAMIVGLIAGALVIFSVEWLELRLSVDDPGGAVSVHAVSGIWGLLAAGLFSRAPGDAGQFTAQLVGVATLLGFVLPLTYGLNWLLDRALPQRVRPEGERQGMDLYELGAGAYPELVTHTDEFTQR